MRKDGLPEDAPYNADGYSVPIEYFKYNPDWRRLVREFQEDLGAGRYEPEWQKQALQAMEERARGDFDEYKDNQFEEFWGQRQKKPRDLAGESSNIKLEDLINHGTIREGDIFSYTRVIGRGKNRVLVEKDMRIVKIKENVLTMGIPPGTLKYARHLPTPETTPTKSAVSQQLPLAKTDDIDAGVASHTTPETPVQRDDLVNGQAGSSSTKLEQNSLELLNGIEDSDSSPKMPKTDQVEPSNLKPLSKDHNPVEPSVSPSTPPRHRPQDAPPQLQEPVEDVILTPITSLNDLDKHCLDIDGRIATNARSVANAWKNIRGKRNNQDLGSLFEMRQDVFVWKHPKIVKEPNTSRSGRTVTSKKKSG